MRKIETKVGKKKREKRNKIIVGLVLVGLMVLSTIGYAFYNTDSDNKEKELKVRCVDFFLLEDNLWHFVIDNNQFSTVFSPKEVQNIPITLDLKLADYYNKPLYFSSDSNREGMIEINRNLGNFIPRAQRACLSVCEEDLPQKDCRNDNIIIIRESNETLIRQEDNCVFLLSPKSDSLKISDAFIYKILDII